ncbi:MAG: PilZ domain-containing protein [Syntrophales bacterium]|nr:PilZ domain-containing protein [Syntrophales bacterium]MDD5232734.1 PilZ domain-containing protein [Syntrophales bacterium]MDD5531584.1 PilZ domain-containing protein [Syntrophales bacterium]
MKEDPYIEVREFSRVDTCVPLQYHLIPEDERDAIRSRIISRASLVASAELPELQDEALSAWFKTISGKLDTIIDLLTSQKEGFASLPMRRVNISGGGMSFATGEKFKAGDILELQMTLYMNQPVTLFIYGEAISCEGRDGSYKTAVKFVHADEEVINAIVKFVFEIQREILREKRR